MFGSFLSRRGALLWGLMIWLCNAACHRPAGRLEYSALESSAEGRSLRYGVYLPPGWDQTMPLPLVVLLHGAGDDATSADRAVVMRALDEAILARKLPPFVMVTPDGDLGFWVNWHDGSHRWKDWVLQEVVPAMHRRYPLLAGPAGLHLVGVSMGGGGGLQMWLQEPARFGSVSILSAPILSADDTRAFLRRFISPQVVTRVFGPQAASQGRDPYTVLAAADALHGSRLLFGAAMRDRDGILSSNHTFHQTLRSRQVPHQFIVFEGRHRWTTWARVFPHVLCAQLDPQCDLPFPSQWRVARVGG